MFNYNNGTIYQFNVDYGVYNDYNMVFEPDYKIINTIGGKLILLPPFN